MRHIFPDDAEMSFLPVDQRIELHKKGRAQNEVRMHWCDTQRQVELHGRHLDVGMDDLGARHTISVGNSESLATMEPLASQLQLASHSLGDEIRTGPTVD